VDVMIAIASAHIGFIVTPVAWRAAFRLVFAAVTRPPFPAASRG
jgi:hypothetical protein